MSPQRYPENRSPIRAQLLERHRGFAELREEYLLGYCYNTARAYWGDLEDLFDWAESESLDVLGLTAVEIARYLAGMQKAGYSSNTIRRRRTAIAGLMRAMYTSRAVE